MKKLNLLLVSLMTAAVLQACSSGAKDSTAAAYSANATKDTAAVSDSLKKDSTSTKMAMDVNKDDAKFAVTAADGGMTEVALAQMAQNKAVNSRVKDFATMMVTDHTKANDELTALAKSKNITLPASPGEDHQKKIADLDKRSGADFDKAYVDAMIDGHKKTAKLFEDEAKDSKDPDLKAFAVKTLPTIKMHLSAIQSIQDNMK